MKRFFYCLILCLIGCNTSFSQNFGFSGGPTVAVHFKHFTDCNGCEQEDGSIFMGANLNFAYVNPLEKSFPSLAQASLGIRYFSGSKGDQILPVHQVGNFLQEIYTAERKRSILDINIGFSHQFALDGYELMFWYFGYSISALVETAKFKIAPNDIGKYYVSSGDEEILIENLGGENIFFSGGLKIGAMHEFEKFRLFAEADLKLGKFEDELIFLPTINTGIYVPLF